MRRTPKDGHTGGLWHSLLEQLQPFPLRLTAHDTDARDVPARPREAGDKPGCQRIPHMRHDDGDRRGCVLGRMARLGPRRDDDIHREPNQLGRQVGEPIVVSLRPAVLDGDGLSLHVAKLAQALAESLRIRPGCIPQIP